MSVTIQIRDVPDELHRKLQLRAASAGLSISAYLLREIKRSLERPTREELFQRLQSRKRVEPRERIADAVTEERENRFGSSDP